MGSKWETQLAEQLLSSLDTLSEVEIERLWFQEVTRRADEMNQGLAQRIPAEIVRREAQALPPEPDGFLQTRPQRFCYTALTAFLLEVVLKR